MKNCVWCFLNIGHSSLASRCNCCYFLLGRILLFQPIVLSSPSSQVWIGRSTFYGSMQNLALITRWTLYWNVLMEVQYLPIVNEYRIGRIGYGVAISLNRPLWLWSWQLAQTHINSATNYWCKWGGEFLESRTEVVQLWYWLTLVGELSSGVEVFYHMTMTKHYNSVNFVIGEGCRTYIKRLARQTSDLSL